VCAVSYLNTVPLVWGMLHGPQQGLFDLTFAVPSACADEVAAGRADIGIVPVATLPGNSWEIYRGTGIACRGPVRSILLISKKPFGDIQVLAADSGSRSSVLLSRVILSNAFGADPAIVTMPPSVESMLEVADAALIIGDAALLADPAALRSSGLHVADLGEEWVKLSGLPMVFAVWAGPAEFHTEQAERAFIESCRFGLQRIDDIVAGEYQHRGISAALAAKYLTEHVVLELGESEYRGMEQFLSAAASLKAPEYIEPATAESEK
jgi:chorismate dehydratase